MERNRRSSAGLWFAAALAIHCGRTEPYRISPLLRDAGVSHLDGGIPPTADGGPRDSGLLDAGSRDAGLLDAGSPLCPSGVVLGSTTCSRTVVFRQLMRSPLGCFVDAVPQTDEVGIARFDCMGGGAEIIFSRGSFVGTLTNGILTACVGTTFRYLDACTWTSAQRIDGPLNGPLRFTYEEKPLSGKSCFSPCAATATVEVL